MKLFNLIWLLLFLMILGVSLNVLSEILGWGLTHVPIFQVMLLSLPVAALVTHSIYSLGLSRAGFFMVLASSIGWMSEVIGLHYFQLFGGPYTYPGEAFELAGVPYRVILYWAVFIYIGYSMTNMLFQCWHQNKPRITDRNWPLLLVFIVLDILTVVAIDLLMDPLEALKGTWVWLEGGAYFGVPWGNFLGWTVTILIVSSLIRGWEYFRPYNHQQPESLIRFFPLLGYSLLYVSLTATALKFGMTTLALIGTLTMGPVIIINLVSSRYLLLNLFDLCVVKSTFYVK